VHPVGAFHQLCGSKRVEDAAGELLAHGTSTPMALPGKGIHPNVEKFIEDKG
jgi:hypothetical protein